MHHGWGHLYGLSVKLGVHDLLHHGPSREGVIRIGIPLDPSRYLELPWAERALEASPGDRVLDLASPKLLAVALARAGVEVVSVDAFPLEVERWQRLAPAGAVPGRGRALAAVRGRELRPGVLRLRGRAHRRTTATSRRCASWRGSSSPADVSS